MTGKQRSAASITPPATPAVGLVSVDVASAAPPRGWRDILRLRLRSLAPKNLQQNNDVLDRYVSAAPSLQNAIDALPGWAGAMPPETGLRAGALVFYLDKRIHWLLRECFDVSGRNVLELGPLEGFHTAMLERFGAAAIDAVEANAGAFLRCLVTKEVLKLHRSSFFLGDFAKWFDEAPRRYDLVVGSGVLYHSDDPVRLLEQLAAATDALYLWTHVFDEAAMPPGDFRRAPFSGRVETRHSHGVSVRLHERSYYHAWRSPAFNGGLRDRHFWVDRDDLLALLAALGFDTLLLADDEPQHFNGPSLSIFARRSAAPGGISDTAGEADAAAPASA